MRLPTAHQIQVERARRSLAGFAKHLWHVIEPAALIWNWHLDVMCEELEQQIRGVPESRKLVFCVPPGTAKSIFVNVLAPAYEWLETPERRKLNLTNDYRLCTRDARRMRDLVRSEQYREVLEHSCRVRGVEPWFLAPDQNEKTNFENSARGHRQCLSIDSTVTGKRADDIVIDDPLDAKEVTHGSIEQINDRLDKVNSTIEKVLPSRVNDLATARWTLIMQRLHTDDPAGRAIAEGGWRVVELPMRHEPGRKLKHPKDPRTKAGELLFPAKFPDAELAAIEIKLGPQAFSAQYQQSPLPNAGGPLKRWDWRFWYPASLKDSPPPPVRTRKPDGTQHEHKQKALALDDTQAWAQSWDCAFKDTKTSDYVVGQVWAALGAESFLIDQHRDRMDINATLDAVRKLSKRWPRALEKYVEDKANGTAVIGLLRTEVPGLVEVQPEGGKVARANASAPAARAGNVYLPHPALYPWVHALLDELEAFPGGSHDDQVDSLTQYLIKRYCVPQPAYAYTPVVKAGNVASIRSRPGGIL